MYVVVVWLGLYGVREIAELKWCWEGVLYGLRPGILWVKDGLFVAQIM
jgi:hypothetical protein